MKMEMSSFRKIKDEPHAAVLRHPDGHEITIAKNGLSSKLKGQLASLPMHFDEGGQVPDGTQSTTDTPYYNGGSHKWEPYPVEKLPVEERVQAPVAPEPDRAPAGVVEDVGGAIGKYLVKPTSDAVGAAWNGAKDAAKYVGNAANEFTSGVAQGAQLDPVKEGTPPESASAAPKGPQNYNLASSRTVSSDPSPNMLGGDMGAYKSAISGFRQGIQGEAKALGDVGKSEAAASGQYIQDANSIHDKWNHEYAQLDESRKHWQHDLENAHIDPNHYINSMSTGKKVMTAIGMLMSGLGSGLTGQPNAAIQFLHDSIDRDIESQKENLGKTKTLLEANLRQFGNMKDAMDMTRVMTADVYGAKIKQAAAQAADPLARSRAMQEAAKFEMGTALPLMQNIAMRRALLGGSSGGMNAASANPAAAIRVLVPEHQQAAAYKELENMQNMQSSRKEATEAFNKLQKLNTIGSRVTSPMQTGKSVDAIREPLVLKLARDASGRVNEYELPGIRAMFPAPGDDSQTLKRKAASLDAFTRQKMHAPSLEAYGIKLPIGDFVPDGAVETPANYPRSK